MYANNKMLNVFSHPLFKPIYGLSYEEHKRLTTERFKYVTLHGSFKADDMFDNPNIYIDSSDLIHMYDISLAIKMGVHFTLFCSAVIKLGTEKHRYLIDGANECSIKGGFAMTEYRGGSNIKNTKTTAVFNPESRTFTINTPSHADQKYWIGDVANDGTHVCVFARLIMDNVDHGVHVFIVQIRDKNGIKKNIHLDDCGPKGGLNGVDNGSIIFDNVVIPYDNLLDKYTYIDDNNIYKTVFTSENNKLNKYSELLIGGRMVLGSGVVKASLVSLLIAIRYAKERKQFGENGDDTIPIIQYKSHQMRIVPRLVTTLLLNGFTKYVRERYVDDTMAKNMKYRTQMLITGLKVIGGWEGLTTFQVCRESTGGHGYSSYNKIVEYRKDIDIFTTFEGDNNVLLQTIVRYLIKRFMTKSRIVKGIYNVIANQFIDNVLIELKAQEMKDLTNLVWKLKMAKNQYNEWNNNLNMIKRIAMRYLYRCILKYGGKYVSENEKYYFGLLLTKRYYLWNIASEELERLNSMILDNFDEKELYIPDIFLNVPILSRL